MIKVRFEGGSADGKEIKIPYFVITYRIPVQHNGFGTGYFVQEYKWVGTIVEEGWSPETVQDHKVEIFRFVDYETPSP